MVFILYKLYILSPYTAPIPKPNHHRRHSAILHFQKTSLSLIYKLVSSWGPKNVPTRTRILDIAIVVGTFCPHNVGYTWTTHTHTHTHTHNSSSTDGRSRSNTLWNYLFTRVSFQPADSISTLQTEREKEQKKKDQQSSSKLQTSEKAKPWDWLYHEHWLETMKEIKALKPWQAVCIL